jgi:hypothetical protein
MYLDVSGARLPARDTDFVACSRKRSLSESQPQQIESQGTFTSISPRFIALCVLRLRQARSVSEAVAQIQRSFAAPAFSRRTTGRAGILRRFASKNASFAPVFSPLSGVQRYDPRFKPARVKILPIFGKALDRKNLEFIV